MNEANILSMGFRRVGKGSGYKVNISGQSEFVVLAKGTAEKGKIFVQYVDLDGRILLVPKE